MIDRISCTIGEEYETIVSLHSGHLTITVGIADGNAMTEGMRLS